MKNLTKQEAKHLEKTINLARGWHEKGFNTNQIAKGVWNSGYPCQAYGPNRIKIQVGRNIQTVDLI
jgi:hypothetical protein